MVVEKENEKDRISSLRETPTEIDEKLVFTTVPHGLLLLRTYDNGHALMCLVCPPPV